jgi:GMP synthase-like glutamine amidotransferase
MTTSPSSPTGARGRVLILQHMATDGAAYLATWLERHGIGFDRFDTAAGQDFPAHLGDWSALAVLGGEMSANDPLPSLRRAESLIREGMAKGRPVIGHCLGGQLMATALGGAVGASPQAEIGWHAIERDDHEVARDWLGDEPAPVVFQWHGEAFTLPAGARRLATNAACPNQAFAIGPHIGMQFHVEVDADKLARWFHATRDQAGPRAVARALDAEPEQAAALLASQQALADRIYARWWSAVPR